MTGNRGFSTNAGGSAGVLSAVLAMEGRRMAAVCPSCGKPSAARPGNRSFPFCSPRCRQVDLGRWLGEEYRVPDRQLDSEPDPLSTAGKDEDGR